MHGLHGADEILGVVLDSQIQRRQGHPVAPDHGDEGLPGEQVAFQQDTRQVASLPCVGSSLDEDRSAQGAHVDVEDLQTAHHHIEIGLYAVHDRR